MGKRIFFYLEICLQNTTHSKFEEREFRNLKRGRRTQTAHPKRRTKFQKYLLTLAALFSAVSTPTLAAERQHTDPDRTVAARTPALP